VRGLYTKLQYVIRYDTVYLTCSKKLTSSQLSLPHGTNRTSSLAVAKRLRDASCLSVVSFNCTKRRVESFIVSYVGYRFVTTCS